MNQNRPAIALVLAAALLAAACAATPKAEPGIASCSALAAQLAQAEQEQKDALDEMKKSWKAVIPVAVAAHYAKGNALANKAAERIREAKEQSATLGCA